MHRFKENDILVDAKPGRVGSGAEVFDAEAQGSDFFGDDVTVRTRIQKALFSPEFFVASLNILKRVTCDRLNSGRRLPDRDVGQTLKDPLIVI